MPFTAAELEEMRLADEEIERDFRLTREDLTREREFEREIQLERMLPEQRRIAEKQKAYREANRDAIAEKKKAYREANRDAIAEKQKWIHDARRQRGYTQKMLAQLLCVSQAAVSRLESGELALSNFRNKDELLRLLGEKECIDAI